MYFTLSQTQYLMVALLGGGLLLLVLGLGYFATVLHFGRSEKDDEGEAEGHEFNDGLVEGNRPIPLVIYILAVVIFLWSIYYVIAVAKGVINVQ